MSVRSHMIADAIKLAGNDVSYIACLSLVMNPQYSKIIWG